MKNFGNTMVMWDLKAMKPEKVFSVPGAPLEIRWALKPGADWAITAGALTSKLYLVKEDEKHQWQAKAVADIGDPSKIPLPVDISISSDATSLWVNTFMDGTARLFDLSNPEAPEAGLFEEDRRAGQYGLAELGRKARLFHHPLCSPIGTRRAPTTSSF